MLVLATALALTISSPDDRADKQRLQKAADDLRQAAYEFGIHLALHDSATIRSELRGVWNRITQLRSLGCPTAVRDKIRSALHCSGSKSLAVKRLSELKNELVKSGLGTYASRVDSLVPMANQEKWSAYHDGLVSLLDEIVGLSSGLPFAAFVDAMREIERTIGSKPKPAEMDAALRKLVVLPGAERARQRAVKESIELIDSGIETATDLYVEGYFQDAGAQFRQLERPFRLLSRIEDPSIALRVKQLQSQIEQARLFIERGVTPPRNRWYVWNSDQQEGFRLMRKSRADAMKILELYGIRVARPSPNEPPPKPKR